MKTVVDQSKWKRKAHFDFFIDFEEPFFGITSEIDCTKAYANAKEMGTSFFLYYLHKSLLAIHESDAFRLRIEEKEVFLYDNIKASATIGRDNGTFGFSYIKFSNSFEEFERLAKGEIKHVKDSDAINPSSSLDVIHYSSVPWIKFTSLTHARKFSRPDSIPKITFGKIIEEKDKKTMPVSIFGHHALMDGFHVAEHLDLFQKHLSSY